MVSLLADEHVRASVVRGLRDRGVDVTTIQDAGLRGATDSRLLDLARDQDRVLLTEDDDILGLARGERHPGVILQTTQFADSGEVVRSIIRLLDSVPAASFENGVFYVP